MTPQLVEIPVQALQSTLRALTSTRDQLNLQIAAISAQLPKITTNVAKTKGGGVDWEKLRRPSKPKPSGVHGGGR